MGDKLITLCGLFFGMTVIAYCIIVLKQYTYLQPATYRLSVLSTRTALLLPLCTFLMFISLVEPSSYVMMMFFITTIEGYCLYAFLALITTNLGGPQATVELMEKSQRPMLCSVCLPKEPVRFFRMTVWVLFHVLAMRSICSLISAICFYSGTKSGKSAYVFFNALSALVLVCGFVCLVNLYENVYEYLINLFGVLKLALLKVSIGAIVIQGLIENILYSTGSLSYDDDDAHSAQEKSMRVYCGLVMVELALLSLLYYYAFGDHKIIPSSAPAAVRAFLHDQRSPHQVSTSGVRAVETLVYSLRSFVADILAIQDVLEVGFFHVDGALDEPLTSRLAGWDAPSTMGGMLSKVGGYMSPGRMSQPWSSAARPGGAGGNHKGPTYSSLPTGAVDDLDAEFSLTDESEHSGRASGAAGGSSGSAGQEGSSRSVWGRGGPLLGMGDMYGSPRGLSPTTGARYVDGDSLAYSPSPGSTSPSREGGRRAAAAEGALSPLVDYSAVYGEFSDVVEGSESV